MAEFRILIADDDQDDYDLIVSVFETLNAGHEFIRAENGAQLIAVLEQAVKKIVALPNLILLDINMPKMDGLQALTIIRSRTDLPSVPVLVYSTSDCNELKKKCFKLGASGFVTKFCSLSDMEKFAVAINNFLEKKGELPGKNLPVKKNNYNPLL